MKKTYPSDLKKGMEIRQETPPKTQKQTLPQMVMAHHPQRDLLPRTHWLPMALVPRILPALSSSQNAPDGRDRWKTVYHYARVWRINGFWENLNTALREILRLRAGRKPTTQRKFNGYSS